MSLFNLIKNEWIKIFNRVGTYVMIGLLVLGVIAAGALMKIYGSSYDTNTSDQQWKQGLSVEIEMYEQEAEELSGMGSEMQDYYERSMAINQYRIDHDIPPSSETNVWTFINESTPFISFAGLFAIIIAAGIVAGEFSSGTIKLLLIRPIKRYKILLSKYATVILFSFFLLATLFISAGIVGFSLFGAGDGSSVHLAYTDGQVVEKSMLLHLIQVFLLSFVDVFMLVTLAFMISVVFRNSSLAIGISIFLLLMGGTVTAILASYFDWAKYILFANTNFMQYFDGVPLVEGMTLGFSVTMIVIYFVIFQVLAFLMFTKRDVAY